MPIAATMGKAIMYLIYSNNDVVGSVVDAGLFLSIELAGIKYTTANTLPEAVACLMSKGYLVS